MSYRQYWKSMMRMNAYQVRNIYFIDSAPENKLSHGKNLVHATTLWMFAQCAWKSFLLKDKI